MRWYLLAALVSALLSTALVVILEPGFPVALATTDSAPGLYKHPQNDVFHRSAESSLERFFENALEFQSGHGRLVARWLWLFAGMLISAVLVLALGCGAPGKSWRQQLRD
jgi:hypothetical protein